MPRPKGQPLDKSEIKEPLHLRITPTSRKGLYGLVQLFAEKSLANLVDSMGWFYYILLPRSASEQFKSAARHLKLDIPTALEKIKRGEITIALVAADKPTLPALIVKKLNEKNWSTEQLAAECRLELSKLDRVLAGKAADDETLVMLAVILQEDIDRLIEINKGVSHENPCRGSSDNRVNNRS